MPVTVNKTKTGPIRLDALQREINADPLVVPSCLSISLTDTNIALEFAAALSGDEDTALDAIITAHAPPSEQMDIVQLPFSPLGKKLHMHPTYKPDSDNSVYVVWTGRSDNMTTGDIGKGVLLDFSLIPGTPSVTKTIRFHPDNGKVWLTQGYLKYEGAGVGDSLDVDLVAEATPLQTATDLDLVLVGNLIKPAPGGAGTGTHGWSDPTKISLYSRSFSKDGAWDYDGTNLIPNLSDTGDYAISDADQIAHNYVIGLPLRGSSSFFALNSEETTEFPKNYALKIRCQNVSNTTWDASVIMKIYRERTVKP